MPRVPRFDSFFHSTLQHSRADSRRPSSRLVSSSSSLLSPHPPHRTHRFPRTHPRKKHHPSRHRMHRHARDHSTAPHRRDETRPPSSHSSSRARLVSSRQLPSRARERGQHSFRRCVRRRRRRRRRRRDVLVTRDRVRANRRRHLLGVDDDEIVIERRRHRRVVHARLHRDERRTNGGREGKKDARRRPSSVVRHRRSTRVEVCRSRARGRCRFASRHARTPRRFMTQHPRDSSVVARPRGRDVSHPDLFPIATDATGGCAARARPPLCDASRVTTDQSRTRTRRRTRCKFLSRLVRDATARRLFRRARRGRWRGRATARLGFFGMGARAMDGWGRRVDVVEMARGDVRWRACSGPSNGVTDETTACSR